MADGLSAIAMKYGLVVERYYHDAPQWFLGFGHPLGGQAKIEVSASEPEEVTVSATWWVDDYTTFTRSILWGPRARVPRNAGSGIEPSSPYPKGSA